MDIHLKNSAKRLPLHLQVLRAVQEGRALTATCPSAHVSACKRAAAESLWPAVVRSGPRQSSEVRLQTLFPMKASKLMLVPQRTRFRLNMGANQKPVHHLASPSALDRIVSCCRTCLTGPLPLANTDPRTVGLQKHRAICCRSMWSHASHASSFCVRTFRHFGARRSSSPWRYLLPSDTLAVTLTIRGPCAAVQVLHGPGVP